MREVIESVIASEAEAKEIVAAARKEAERVVANAKREAAELLASVRAEARAEAGQRVESAIRGAEQEKQERLSLAAAGIKCEISLHPAIHQRAVEEVVRCVCGMPKPFQDPA